jgi:hypothetical protein
MGWKPEVYVEDKWSRNGLVFATEEEALASAKDLMGRWMNVNAARAVEVPGEPATHAFAPDDDGVLSNRLLPRDS